MKWTHAGWPNCIWPVQFLITMQDKLKAFN